MTNFFRLIGLARAYRGRFLVSLVCAGFVALLWSANIGLVYPLLNILFHNGNCQIWVADQIASARVEIASLEARIEEVDALADWNAQGRDPEAFRKRFDAIDEEALHLRGEQRRAERERAALIAAEPLAPTPLPPTSGSPRDDSSPPGWRSSRRGWTNSSVTSIPWSSRGKAKSWNGGGKS